MAPKRKTSISGSSNCPSLSAPSTKRARVDDNNINSHVATYPARHNPTDLISPLSDELLVRILSYLSPVQLLETAPVSRRFYRLTSDSQLWRAHYVSDFLVPRTARLRAGRPSAAISTVEILSRESRNRPKAADRDGSLGINWKRRYKLKHNWSLGKCAVGQLRVREAHTKLPRVSRSCANEEDASCCREDVGAGFPDTNGSSSSSSSSSSKLFANATLVKIADGIAVTADPLLGLRAWHLKTRRPIAQAELGAATPPELSQPTCLSIDNQEYLDHHQLNIAVGFANGGVGIWKLEVVESFGKRTDDTGLESDQPPSNGGIGYSGRFRLRYQSKPVKNDDGVVALAYLYPYLLTANASSLISLYAFSQPLHESLGNQKSAVRDLDEEENQSVLLDKNDKTRASLDANDYAKRHIHHLPTPHLMTSLCSPSTRIPLALSLRQLPTCIVASVAYTVATFRGWSIGLQDIHVDKSAPAGLKKKQQETGLQSSSPCSRVSSRILNSRLAYSAPLQSQSHRKSSRHRRHDDDDDDDDGNVQVDADTSARIDGGPLSLCYSHPYLLATLPDNTLILYLCKSNTATLSISNGTRLWGHTSGIGYADITPRGRAVSVSFRGDEIRLWELEGRAATNGYGHGGGVMEDGLGLPQSQQQQQQQQKQQQQYQHQQSIELKPTAAKDTKPPSTVQDSSRAYPAEEVTDGNTDVVGKGQQAKGCGGLDYNGRHGGDDDDRKSWVGFDEEMVLVLRQSRDGGESLMVYDFT